MKMIKSKAVKKFYYCYCCKNFISQPTYDSEGAKCPKCGWSIVKIKKPKSENEALAILLQLAILSEGMNYIDSGKKSNDTIKSYCSKCDICAKE